MISATADIHKDITNDTISIPLHSHNFWEILFCCHGDVKYIIKNRQYLFQAGNILIIEPETAHQPLISSKIQLSYDRYVLRIQTNFLEKCASVYPDVFSVIEKCRKSNNWMLEFSSFSITQNINSFFELMENEMLSQQEHWQDAINLQVLQLFLYLNRFYSNAKEMTGQTADDQLLESLIQYVFSNYSLPITLEKTAKDFCTSQSKISHLFKDRLDTSFYQYVIKTRLIAAKRHLFNEVPITEIWKICGFTDYSTFYRLFKKEYGFSPRQFRELFFMNNFDTTLNVFQHN